MRFAEDCGGEEVYPADLAVVRRASWASLSAGTLQALPAFPNGEHAVEVRQQGDVLGAPSVAMPPSDPMNPAKESSWRTSRPRPGSSKPAHGDPRLMARDPGPGQRQSGDVIAFSTDPNRNACDGAACRPRTGSTSLAHRRPCWRGREHRRARQAHRRQGPGRRGRHPDPHLPRGAPVTAGRFQTGRPVDGEVRLGRSSRRSSVREFHDSRLHARGRREDQLLSSFPRPMAGKVRIRCLLPTCAVAAEYIAISSLAPRLEEPVALGDSTVRLTRAGGHPERREVPPRIWWFTPHAGLF